MVAPVGNAGLCERLYMSIIVAIAIDDAVVEEKKKCSCTSR